MTVGASSFLDGLSKLEVRTKNRGRFDEHSEQEKLDLKESMEQNGLQDPSRVAKVANSKIKVHVNVICTLRVLDALKDFTATFHMLMKAQQK